MSVTSPIIRMASPGPGKGLAPDHLVGKSQLLAQQTDLVLEEMFQRLHQFQFHLFRKAAHVMVGLDHGAGAAEGGTGFNHIGVKGSLGEKFDTP